MTTRSVEQSIDSQIGMEVRPRGFELLQDAGLVVGASMFMALCAHISVPLGFSPVPVTLQTFGVLLIGLTLGSRRALAAMMLYLIEGASGMPVFSPSGFGGVAQLLGPTGGFLFAYPAAAYVAGSFARNRSKFTSVLSATILAEFVIFFSGALWFSLLTGMAPARVLALAVLPFIPGEVLKVAAATGIAAVWNRKLRA
jgi:biotin transport system substrate-specific component